VTHGFTAPVVKWLQDHGLDAQAIPTRYEGERDDAAVEVAGDVAVDVETETT
jgi:putative mRNA 3-end processing factor